MENPQVMWQRDKIFQRNRKRPRYKQQPRQVPTKNLMKSLSERTSYFSMIKRPRKVGRVCYRYSSLHCQYKTLIGSSLLKPLAFSVVPHNHSSILHLIIHNLKTQNPP